MELHATAVDDDYSKRTSCHMTTVVGRGRIECHALMSSDGCSASLSLCLAVPSAGPEVTDDAEGAAEAIGVALKKAVKKMDAELVPLCARVFYKCGHSLAQHIVKGRCQHDTLEDNTCKSSSISRL